MEKLTKTKNNEMSRNYFICFIYPFLDNDNFNINRKGGYTQERGI